MVLGVNLDRIQLDNIFTYYTQTIGGDLKIDFKIENRTVQQFDDLFEFSNVNEKLTFQHIEI